MRVFILICCVSFAFPAIADDARKTPYGDIPTDAKVAYILGIFDELASSDSSYAACQQHLSVKSLLAVLNARIDSKMMIGPSLAMLIIETIKSECERIGLIMRRSV